VKFYASLGNHDETNARLYKPFNMDGKSYYTFKRANAEFFVLDSNYMDPQQLGWLDKALQDSSSPGRSATSIIRCIPMRMPMVPTSTYGNGWNRSFGLMASNLVFSGHDHDYERIRPQNGIVYIVLGNSGQLRFHDLKPSPDTAQGFDTDLTFELVEIAGGTLYFQAVSRTGQTVDSGSVELAGKAHATGQW